MLLPLAPVPVRAPVRPVLRLRSPLEIRRNVVGWVAVQVPHLHRRARRFPAERGTHEPVDALRHAAVLVRERDPEVALSGISVPDQRIPVHVLLAPKALVPGPRVYPPIVARPVVVV